MPCTLGLGFSPCAAFCTISALITSITAFTLAFSLPLWIDLPPHLEFSPLPGVLLRLLLGLLLGHPLGLLFSLSSLLLGLSLCLLLGHPLHQLVASATRLLIKLGNLDFKRVFYLLNEIGWCDALPVNFVSVIAIAIAAAVGVVASRHDRLKKKYEKGRKMDWLTLKVRLIYLLTELFELRQWLHTLSVETALTSHGLGPKRGILSWPWHQINPSSTPSDHVYTFTAHSTVCTYISWLSLFSLYHHQSVSALSIPSICMIT